jgi:hypothetical protein
LGCCRVGKNYERALQIFGVNMWALMMVRLAISYQIRVPIRMIEHLRHSAFTSAPERGDSKTFFPE